MEACLLSVSSTCATLTGCKAEMPTLAWTCCVRKERTRSGTREERERCGSMS